MVTRQKSILVLNLIELSTTSEFALLKQFGPPLRSVELTLQGLWAEFVTRKAIPMGIMKWFFTAAAKSYRMDICMDL